jgi:quercetin dioxygenase-like cupin family protein
MNVRSLGIAIIAFFVGAAAFWAVSTRTGWLHFLLQKPSEYHALNTDEMNWVEGGRGGPASYSMKYLYKDPETHEVFMLVRYPAGQAQPPHVHNYGHAIYVLQGKLVTHQGTYGPGSFVWFPPNEVVAHGASADEDLVILFIRHEDMEINYVQPTHSH